MFHPYHVVEIIQLSFFIFFIFIFIIIFIFFYFLFFFIMNPFYLSFERFKKHCTSPFTSSLVRIHMGNVILLQGKCQAIFYELPVNMTKLKFCN
jgi:hypothetical protein